MQETNDISAGDGLNSTNTVHAHGRNAQYDGPDAAHRRPEGASDETVQAVGKLSEALEIVEHARGLLYGFHRLTGTADLALGEAVDMLREAHHDDLADDISRRIVGRNVVSGQWTFQLVEDYDDGYYAALKAAEQHVRDKLLDGKRHLFEAEMKEDRRTHGLAHHEALPQDVAPISADGENGSPGQPTSTQQLAGSS